MNTTLGGILFPGYDWTLYEIVNHEIIDNEDSKIKRFYKKKLVVCNRRKECLPGRAMRSERLVRYGFGTSIQYDDFPTRDMVTQIVLKTRKREHKTTKETASKKVDPAVMVAHAIVLGSGSASIIKSHTSPNNSAPSTNQAQNCCALTHNSYHNDGLIKTFFAAKRIITIAFNHFSCIISNCCHRVLEELGLTIIHVLLTRVHPT